MKKTLSLRKILLLVAFIGLCATGIVNAQALKVNELWGSKLIHIGLNDANSTDPTKNWLLTFGNGGSTNMGMWSIGMFGNGLNINRINSGSVRNPGNGIVFIDTIWNVGIGVGSGVGAWMSPQYRLDVRGDIYCSGQYRGSDKRYKKDIEPLNENVDKLLKLNSVKYKRSSETLKAKYDEFKKLSETENDIDKQREYEANLLVIERSIKEIEENTRIYFGFIAQELKELYPEVVSEDNEGFLGVDYVGLIPVLVEAIKELNAKLEGKNFEKGAAVLTSEAKLYQNNPNPFTSNTEIKYYLPNETKEASIRIYNLVGEEIAKFDLLDRGYANLTINGNVLKAGMYNYALLVDGQLIDTKQMVLTR